MSSNFEKHCMASSRHLELVRFETSMVGELTFFLGFQIQQCAYGIFLSQGKYARTLITKFELNKAKSKRIPAALHLKLLKDDSGEKIDEGLYRSIIRSLLYFTTSRPDIGRSNDRKSTPGGYFFLGNNLTMCLEKSRAVFCCPLSKSKYIAVSSS
ncbi:putative mitochondrial protein [Cucumis melo var. makuwa]|uniref:Mitochondrial protein n=1 Tax=Cucumis melo var. makuwa TaxID=1194695 RepID=A0A5D3BEC5_CUCMM|nr:putative mitochondrial protein [Cucumis melo var. makuwa]TYJ97477.1 putative mitochondrial protein [Cucumis melo var. makuwa]